MIYIFCEPTDKPDNLPDQLNLHAQNVRPSWGQRVTILGRS